MNNHLRLPGRDQLARPSPELDRRMDALFASADSRSSSSRIIRPPWRALLAPIGLAATVVLFLIGPWRTRPHPSEPATAELRILSANLATALLPADAEESAYRLSIRSY